MLRQVNQNLDIIFKDRFYIAPYKLLLNTWFDSKWMSHKRVVCN